MRKLRIMTNKYFGNKRPIRQIKFSVKHISTQDYDSSLLEHGMASAQSASLCDCETGICRVCWKPQRQAA